MAQLIALLDYKLVPPWLGMLGVAWSCGIGRDCCEFESIKVMDLFWRLAAKVIETALGTAV